MKLSLKEKNEHLLQLQLKSEGTVDSKTQLLKRCRVYMDDLPLDDLVGMWHFENNEDESGNGNHATIFGASFTTGKVGKALFFDGNDDYAVIPHSSSLISDSITVAFWLYVHTDPDCDSNNNWRIVVKKGGASATTTGWNVVLEENTNLSWAIGTGISNRIIGAARADLRVWNHFTFTYDSKGIMKVYKNGINVASKKIDPSPILSNTSDIEISKGNTTGCPNGNGYAPIIIDEFRIYKRALTDSEILELYNAMNSTLRIFEGIIIEKEEVGEYNKVVNIVARDLFKDRLLTRIVNMKYNNMKAGEIFRDIVRQLGPEFTLNSVEDTSIVVSEDFPYFQAQLACDTLAEDAQSEYYCKPNLDCVFKHKGTDDSGLSITEKMIKSITDVKRSYAESISEVIVVGGLDTNNERVIARAVNMALPKVLQGRRYVLHDQRYTTYISAKLKALNILSELGKEFMTINPIFVKDVRNLPIPGQMVTLNMPSYGIHNVKVQVTQIEINTMPGEKGVLWLKFFLGETEKTIEDRLIIQQQAFELERTGGIQFEDISFQQLVNASDSISMLESNTIKLCKRFFLDSVPDGQEGCLFGLDGGNASELDL